MNTTQRLQAILDTLELSDEKKIETLKKIQDTFNRERYPENFCSVEGCEGRMFFGKGEMLCDSCGTKIQHARHENLQKNPNFDENQQEPVVFESKEIPRDKPKKKTNRAELIRNLAGKLGTSGGKSQVPNIQEVGGLPGATSKEVNWV